MGFDARQLTPTVVLRITVLAAETRSFARAEKTARDGAGLEVSAKTIERVVHDVGRELQQRRDAPANSGDPLAQRPEAPPDLAVAECDGGRIRTREPGHGPGVHRSGEGWREDKNACLIRAKRRVFAEDPQPEPPACFCDTKHVAKIAETEALSVAAPLPSVPKPVEQDEPRALPEEDWRPKRLMRTVLSGVANSEQSGRQMAREAKQRRFYEAAARAFLGDGLPWNWSIWKEHFRGFTPILDFTHVLTYLFVVAKAIHPRPEDAWAQYLVWMRGCWQGEVAQVLEELRVWQGRLGTAPPEVPEHDPRRVVAKTITYLEHNQSRMNYPEYRRQGMPVTTAWMESLVKEINYRAKGTEMFWNDPEGAEAILQVRAAALCDDDRLAQHLKTRPGHPLTRRPKAPIPPARKRKS
ncbi:MAG: LysR family transcriptional regulator [Planctomycetota bacterium]